MDGSAGFVDLVRESPLLSTLDPEGRDALAPCFQARPFADGDLLIRAGSDDRDLLLLLRGSARVWVSDGKRRFPVAELAPGAMLGEVAFFDPQAPRTADVVASTPGLAAALTVAAYDDLLASRHPAAAALETSVLWLLGGRMQRTNQTIRQLLDDHDKGGLLAGLSRVFGGRVFGGADRESGAPDPALAERYKGR